MFKLYLPKHTLFSGIFSLFLIISVFKVNAQCPPGDVVLNSQAQVNQFIIDYPNCTVINGNLTIRGADIVNLNGLDNLVEVTGYLGVYDNNLLENFTGLESLTTLGASLDVSDNPGLLNANGLSGLTNVGTEIQFFNNAQLQNISSLTGVTGIGGGVWIIQNPQLQSLNGLQNILQVGGDIEVRDNTILNNITALQNINPSSITPSGTYGLTIKNNPAVSVCNLPNFCSYLAHAAATHPRDIAGNAGDCLTEQAVISACILSLDEFGVASLNAYPNPVADILNITYNKNIENLSVINVFGQEVISKKVNATGIQLDMSTLPAGNYFIKVNLGGMVKTIKVLKQ